MIVSARRAKPGVYTVTLWSSCGYPFASYSDVKVYLDNSLLEDLDELYVEALEVEYIKEKAEIRIYTAASTCSGTSPRGSQ